MTRNVILVDNKYMKHTWYCGYRSEAICHSKNGQGKNGPTEPILDHIRFQATLVNYYVYTLFIIKILIF